MAADEIVSKHVMLQWANLARTASESEPSESGRKQFLEISECWTFLAENYIGPASECTPCKLASCCIKMSAPEVCLLDMLSGTTPAKTAA